MKPIETLDLHQTAIAVAACARAGVVPLVIGCPGVGKTALARAITPLVAKAMGYDDDTYKPATCILSNRDAVDIAGYPVVNSDDSVSLVLFGSLSEASKHPRLLNLDEFLTCSQSVQGPALRLTLERVAGETPLHDDTRIVAMANPPDQAPGGIQPTAALVNRLVILHCVPKVAEVANYFCARPEASLAIDVTLPDEETFKATKARLMDTAGILFEQRPDLLVIDKPPPAAINDGEPFGSPRAWEACCAILAALPAGHLVKISDVARSLVLGAIGPVSGIPFLSIMRARVALPSVQEIITTPDSAKLPDQNATIDIDGKMTKVGRDVDFAAIPLVIEAARVDTFAAWVYVVRLPIEIRAALAKSLAVKLATPPGGSKWHAQGQRAMLDTIERLATGGTSAKDAKKKAS